MAGGMLEEARGTVSPQQSAPVEQQAAPMGGMPDDDPMTLPGVEEASPEDQQMYEQALAAVAQVIYEDDKSHIRIMKMVQKVGEAEGELTALVKATVTVITEVDKQIDIPEDIIINIADEVFMMIAELANKAYGFDATEKQMKQGIAATIEIILKTYGMEESEWYNMAGQYDEPQAQELMGYIQEMQ